MIKAGDEATLYVPRLGHDILNSHSNSYGRRPQTCMIVAREKSSSSLILRPGVMFSHLMGAKAMMMVGMAKRNERRKAILHFRVVLL